jgi:hypothetical protein
MRGFRIFPSVIALVALLAPLAAADVWLGDPTRVPSTDLLPGRDGDALVCIDPYSNHPVGVMEPCGTGTTFFDVQYDPSQPVPFHVDWCIGNVCSPQDLIDYLSAQPPLLLGPSPGTLMRPRAAARPCACSRCSSSRFSPAAPRPRRPRRHPRTRGG